MSRKLSESTKKKISESVKRTLVNKKLEKLNTTLICPQCGNEYKPHLKTDGHIYYPKFCSKECSIKYHHDLHVNIGKKVASKLSESKRSKNEMLFCSLCEKYFDTVTHNDPIFNGWDADVLIWDLKVAVLWNGKWHYEKIMDKHSVKQVQNRDSIKIEEIKRFGWFPYVIKDLGKYNPKFVKEQFDLFIKTAGIV